MRLDKAFEPYDLIQMSPEEIVQTDFEIDSYETAIRILKWKIEDEIDEDRKSVLKAQLRACIDRAAMDYYPWLEICKQMAKDIASGTVKEKHFSSVIEVLNYYRSVALKELPELWRKNCARLYRGSEHNYTQS